MWVKIFNENVIKFQKFFEILNYKTSSRKIDLFRHFPRCRDSMVCRSVTLLSSAKTAEAIKMPFALRTRLGPRNHALDIAKRFKLYTVCWTLHTILPFSYY